MSSNDYESVEERRALVAKELRDDPEFNYEDELMEEVNKALSDGFDELSRTEEYLAEKQREKLERVKSGYDFDDDGYEADQWEIYCRDNREETIATLRKPYEKAFQQQVNDAMLD